MSGWQIIGYLCALVVGLAGLLSKPSQRKKAITCAIAIILIIGTTITFFMKTEVDLSEESTEAVAEDVAEKTADLLFDKLLKDPLMVYLDNLPYTENLKLRNLFELAQIEQRRANKIKEAIRKGSELANKQYIEATLKAIEYYIEGLAANPTTTERCALHILIGLAYRNISKYDDAVVAWEEVLQIAEEIELNSEFYADAIEASATAYNNLGSLSATRGDFDQAIELFNNALEINEILHRSEGIAMQKNNLGNVYFLKGDTQKAKTFYLTSYEMKLNIGDVLGSMIQLNNIGVLYLNQGLLDSAEIIFEEIINTYSLYEDKEGMAIAYNNLGIINQKRNNLDAALEMHTKALLLDIEIGNKEGLASDYGNIGVVYHKKDWLDSALTLFDRSLAISAELGCELDVAQSYGNLGMVWADSGVFDRAEQFYRKSLQIYSDIGAEQKAEWIIVNLEDLRKQEIR
jgi:tetratricopeptide (TPR) repeat protein